MSGAPRDPVERARQLIAADMERFEESLAEALRPQKEYLSDTEYELYQRGKKLRPLMLLLAARMAGGEGGPLPAKAVSASVSLEMLHVATLIHDDIVDVAPMRRGLKTVYSERGTEMAVLIGDLQFIQAVRCFAEAVDTEKDMRLVRMVLDVGFKICCGELDEIRTDPGWDAAALRERYFGIVDRKTAVLFGLACESGASLAGARTRATYYVSQFGRRFGRAFQIMDDIFDYVRPETASGKAPGADLTQRRVTLPLIYALEELPPGHAARRILKGEPYTPAELKGAIRAVALSSGLFRAYSEARRIMIEAVACLDFFPEGDYREALRAIAEHVINRGFHQSDAGLERPPAASL